MLPEGKSQHLPVQQGAFETGGIYKDYLRAKVIEFAKQFVGKVDAEVSGIVIPNAQRGIYEQIHFARPHQDGQQVNRSLVDSELYPHLDALGFKYELNHPNGKPKLQYRINAHSMTFGPSIETYSDKGLLRIEVSQNDVEPRFDRVSIVREYRERHDRPIERMLTVDTFVAGQPEVPLRVGRTHDLFSVFMDYSQPDRKGDFTLTDYHKVTGANMFESFSGTYKGSLVAWNDIGEPPQGVLNNGLITFTNAEGNNVTFPVIQNFGELIKEATTGFGDITFPALM